MKLKNILKRKLLEGHYEQLFKYANDIIIIQDSDLKIVDVNNRALEAYGYTSKEMLGMDISLLLAPSIREQIPELKKYLDEVGTVFFVTTRIRKDGSEFQSEVSVRKIEIAGKKYYQSIGRDITKREEGAKALREAELKFRTIFDNATDGILLAQEGSRNFFLANKRICEMLGYTQEEICNLNVNDIHPKEALPYVSEQFDKQLRGETSIALDIPIQRKDRTTFYVDINSSPISFEGEKYLLGIFRDITERKKAEEKLRESYTFSDSILKTIPFGMDIVDESGTVLFLNDNLNRLFGKEAIGKKCWELFRDNKTQCSDCPLSRGINIGETEVYESHGVLGNRIFEIHHSGMIYEGKKAMLEIIQDITDRKKDEEELLLAKAKAEENDRLKTAFLNNISHEIRTPMNAIVGFCSLLNEPDIDSSTRQSYIDTIINSSDHLLSIITDIIHISNIEANIVKISRDEIHLNSLIKSLSEQFLPLSNEKNISLISKPGLSDMDSVINSDRTKLIQIISNLLNNAFKFTHKGQIKFGYKVKGKLLEFFVSDTGLGILEENNQKIFDRFYQVEDPVTQLYEGTGLGLTICKAYVELLGGEIRVTSTPGVGSTFYFTLPFEKSADKVKIALSSMKQTGFIFPEKKKILVAEDIDSNFKLIEYFLSGANVDVMRASNGKEAVKKCLADHTIDMVLMDIKMPIMDGYEATKVIRETDKNIPIIAETAYPDNVIKVIDNGCSGIITKPFNKEELLYTIKEFI